MNLGKAIKTCRISRGLSIKKLAKRSGISTSHLSLLERNNRNPNIRTIEKVANSLDMPAFLLVCFAEDQEMLAKINPELAEKLSYAFVTLEEMEEIE